MKLDIFKVGKSGFCQFDGDQRLYVWSTYQVTVHAHEFRRLAGAATLNLLHDVGSTRGVVFATCELVADPLRRDVRTGTLSIGDSGHASLFDSLFAAETSGASEDFLLHVTAGVPADTVIMQKVPLQWAPRAVQAGGGSPSGSSDRWIVVDGVSSGNSFPVEDMSQTKFDVSRHFGPVDIVPLSSGVPATGPFEAYVTFVVGGPWSLGRSVTVNGAPVVWDYEDSKLLVSGMWTVHLQSISGVWHGTLRANDSAAPGTELDPDNDLMPGAGVN